MHKMNQEILNPSQPLTIKDRVIQKIGIVANIILDRLFGPEQTEFRPDRSTPVEYESDINPYDGSPIRTDEFLSEKVD